MTRRKRTLLAVGLLAMAVSSVVALLWHTGPPQGITAENASAIYPGMTDAAVERLLGPATGGAAPSKHGNYAKSWIARDVQIAVLFDGATGRVIDGEAEARDSTEVWQRGSRIAHQDAPFLARLRRWLGL